MQPWERMALVRSRALDRSGDIDCRWSGVLDEAVYEFPWDEGSLDSIRHLKRRIETEKSRESRAFVDFKYGSGGITDLEFLVQFLQIRYGQVHARVRTPDLARAVQALQLAGALSAHESESLLAAHRFLRHVENHYQLMEEWASREISRESPKLVRLARSLGITHGSPLEVRRRFLASWDRHARAVRRLIEKYFYQS